MIIDQYAPISDPMVFTGSHNWSAAADNDNDENTLIVHDATLANVYYQQFVHRFEENLGVLFELTDPPIAVDDLGETGINEIITIPVLDNDVLEAPVTVSIEQHATQGSSYIPFANPNVISYLPNPEFIGLDSIVYKIVYKAEQSLFATAKIYINVIDNSGVEENAAKENLTISPNPAKDEINIQLSSTLNRNATLSLYDLMGKQRIVLNLKDNQQLIHLNLSNARLEPGIYIVALKDEKTIITGRLVIWE